MGTKKENKEVNATVKSEQEVKTPEQRCEEIKASIDKLVEDWNNLSLIGADRKSCDELEAKISKLCDDYNTNSKVAYIADKAAKENPMRSAAIDPTYKTIRLRKGFDDDNVATMEIVDGTKIIDPLDIHRAVDNGIGNDPMWQYKIESLNFLLTAHRCFELGVDTKEVNTSYKMSKKAKEVSGLAMASGLSENGFSIDENKYREFLIADIKTVVSAMLGDDVAKSVGSPEAAWLNAIYTKKGKSMLTVTAATHKYMRQYFIEILHKLVTGQVYHVDYKKVKA